MAFRRDKTLAAAERYAARGQHAKACKEYQAVVDNDPGDLRVWLLLADSLTRSGRKDDAVDRYLTVAKHYAKADEPQKALAVYRQVLALEPSRLDVQLQCAKLFRELGRVSDAVVVFERIAQSTLAAGNPQEAIRLYQTVIELDPSSPSKRVRLAELYSREEMIDEAVEQFRHCAELLLEQGRREDYVKVGERLLFHRPEQHDVVRQLSRAYLELGESRRALIKLNTLLQAEPADVEGLELLGETFLALGKLGKAVSVMVELARVQSERGREGRAIARRVLRKALQWDLHDPQLRAMLAAVGEDSAHDRPSPGSRATVVASESDTVADESSGDGLELGIDFDRTGTSTMPIEVDEVEELEAEELEELDAEELEELEFDEFDEFDEEDETRVRTVPEALFEELGRGDYADDEGEERQAAESLENVVGESREDLDKALAEVRVLIKYHLFDHALSHVDTVIADPNGRRAGLELRAQALQKLGRPGEAADALAELARLLEPTDKVAACAHATAALALDDGHVAAQGMVARLAVHARGGAPTHAPGDAEDRSASDEVALDLFPDGPPVGRSMVDDDLSVADSPDDFAIAFETDDEVAPVAEAVEVEDRFGLEEDSRADVSVTEGSSSFEIELDLGDREPSIVAAAPESQSSSEPQSASSDDALRLDSGAFGRETGSEPESHAEPEPESSPAASLDELRSALSSPRLGRARADTHKPTPAEPAAVAKPAPVGPTPAPTAANFADIDEEVEEIEFFLAQQLVDDARAAFADLAARHPGHPRLLALESQLIGGQPTAVVSEPAVIHAPKPSQPSPAARPLSFEDEDDEDAYVAAIFDHKEPSMATSAPSSAGAAAEPLDEADASTHFDLGTAYRDMGLVDQAIREFEASAADARWRARSLVMIAKLQQQTGDTATAIRTLQQGLDNATTEDERTDANYELGLLYEQTGQVALAIAALERVRVGFRDRDERLETLLG